MIQILVVVGEITRKESGWKVELKTVGDDGEKNYAGFAVLPVSKDVAVTLEPGQLLTINIGVATQATNSVAA